MRFYLFFLFFYFPIVCFSDYEIKSKNFSFTKDNLFLKDTIELNSMFGKITSLQAGLYKGANKLFLDGMVNVSLKEGGQIASTSAFLDMLNKKAQFFSKNNKQANFDINNRTKLNLTSDEIEYDLNNDLLLSFTKNVVACIDNDIKCLGGKAYLKNTPTSHIELYPEGNLNFCSFSNKNNKFLAKKAQIEIEDKDLAMQDAKGSYFLPFMKGQDITFSSKKLFFNIKDNELILEEDVIISKSGIGDIKSNEVKIFQDDNKNLKKILCTGKTKFNSYNNENEFSSKIKCDGIIELDNLTHTIKASSPTAISYKDKNIKVYAKEAFINYDLVKTTFKPKKIVLNNGVYFTSDNIQGKLSCGIAEKAIYLPESKNLILLSANGKNVLFFQEDNSLTLSAKEIHIRRNLKTHDDIINGVGNVRFSFNLEEETFVQKIMQKYFDLNNE